MKTEHYTSHYQNEMNHWWHRNRRELVLRIVQQISTKGPMTILDVGCGTCATLKELETFGTVYGIDVSSIAVKYCNLRGVSNVVQGDVTSIPFPDAKFDVVLALDVLEHIDDDSKALCEIIRVTKPGGHIILFVPAFMFLWSATDVRSEHKRRYTLNELKRLIERAGVPIVRISYFNTFLFIPILLVRTIARVLKLKINDENSIGTGINNFLYRVFKLETQLLERVSFPFGVSIFALCRKEK